MKVVFAGTPDFAAGYLKALIKSHHDICAVICQPDKPGKRGKHLIEGPVKTAASIKNIPILQPMKLEVRDLKKIDFDLLVVVAYGQILSVDILNYPKFGCINVHASLLPKWRGAAPVQRSILAGDKTTGISIMTIDESLDSGDILASEPIAIKQIDTSGTILEKMLTIGTALLIKTIDEIESNQVLPIPQNNELATYAKKISPTEARINWESSASNVDLHVRAFHPSPIAYTYIGKTRVKVHQGQSIEGSGTPGALIKIDKNGIDVACGEGVYRIKKVQLSVGKGKVMGPVDVMNGWADFLKVNATFNSNSFND